VWYPDLRLIRLLPTSFVMIQSLWALNWTSLLKFIIFSAISFYWGMHDVVIWWIISKLAHKSLNSFDSYVPPQSDIRIFMFLLSWFSILVLYVINILIASTDHSLTIHLFILKKMSYYELLCTVILHLQLGRGAYITVWFSTLKCPTDTLLKSIIYFLQFNAE